MTAKSGIASSLGSLQHLRSAPAPTAAAGPVAVPAPAEGMALQKTGKCSHPDFQRVGIYVRKSTRVAAERKWEDAGGGDLSDLVERLLSDYVSKGLRD